MANIIAFDVDGTLFNTMKGVQAALNHTLAVYKLPPVPDEDMSQYIGPPIRESFTKLLNNRDLAEEATVLFRQVYVDKYLKLSAYYENMEHLLPKLILEKDAVLCIATLKTQRQMEILSSQFSLSDSFDTILGTTEDGKLKKWQMLMSLKEKYGMENNTFYMIGDTMRDYEAAKEADFHFIGVSYGYGSFPDNFEHPVADSVMEIAEYI